MSIQINIYIDLSKAFDTLKHSILLDKLSHYGVNSVAKNLPQSYLSNRHKMTLMVLHLIHWKLKLGSHRVLF